ncbi:alpha-amylase [Sphingomonas ginkgonis]|uniref:Alpha-amylase n=1 Tax=Sphingomonas ginkgonis TaxID=2315330 RepID=A0A429V7A6_9SPHN|nr:alpha-amylase family glycosyl hydrolase [Sphingomonas ginkgonis]RST29861.1 alpha-amylase [Sphingomonas ginkgonis]
MMSLLAFAAASLASPPAPDYRARLPQDEVIYFLLPDRFENGDPRNDRGGYKGGRLQTGFDPAARGFYHGGDLKGLTRRLDYIQGLGVTAIWVGPIFVNKPVQGPPGQESAGYHGYWITDFTRVDPHLGTNEDFARLVEAAHARGMKVYMDIIANHTADVIKYRECEAARSCPFRSVADYPYQRRGGIAGAPINPGFAGEQELSAANFGRLTKPSYAYDVFVPKGEEHVKKPDWLNDPLFYHNRGDSTFEGESVTTGDFSGLDDLFTENPRVVAGMIDIYGNWIDRFGIDGFRVDTAQHVNPQFWAAFVPAMTERARVRGIPNFTVFGEAFTQEMDPAHTAVHTRVDRFPAMLDFPFAVAVIDTVARNKGTSELARLFRADPIYDGGAKGAQQLPTFLGNHDAGRFAMFVRQANPQASDAEQLARVELGYAMLLTLRGVPTIYSGDEQGFAGTGGDQSARQDMFASKVAEYNSDRLVGTTATTARANFDTRHPLYRAIAALAKIRSASQALRRGLQTIRFAADKPGLFAVSRFDPDDGRETLLLFNTSGQPLTQNVTVETRSAAFSAAVGPCPARAQAPGSVRVTLPAFGYAVCHAAR